MKTPLNNENGFSLVSVLVSTAIMLIAMMAMNEFMLQSFRNQANLQDMNDISSLQTSLQTMFTQRGTCKGYISNLADIQASQLTSTEGSPVTITLPGGVVLTEGRKMPGSERVRIRKIRFTDASLVSTSSGKEYVSNLVVGFERINSTQIFRDRSIGVIRLLADSTASKISDCATTTDTLLAANSVTPPSTNAETSAPTNPAGSSNQNSANSKDCDKSKSSEHQDNRDGTMVKSDCGSGNDDKEYHDQSWDRIAH